MTRSLYFVPNYSAAAAAAAKSLQSCLTLCNPVDGSPPGSAIPGIQLCPTLCDPIDSTPATRLPHPWNSPGKNTGVGCHFLLQCMKVKSENVVTQSCRNLSDPMDCSLPGHGIFQARVLEWVAIAFSM